MSMINRFPSGGIRSGVSWDAIEEFVDEGVTYEELTEATVYGTVIPAAVMSRQYALETVHLLAGLERIEVEAFYNDSALTIDALPDSLLYIGMRAFASCAALGVKSLPEGLTHIGVQAFEGCEGLITMWIPAACEIEDMDDEYNVSAPFYNCAAGLVLYTDAASKPTSWPASWNQYDSNDDVPMYLTVVWNTTKSAYDAIVG